MRQSIRSLASAPVRHSPAISSPDDRPVLPRLQLGGQAAAARVAAAERADDQVDDDADDAEAAAADRKTTHATPAPADLRGVKAGVVVEGHGRNFPARGDRDT